MSQSTTAIRPWRRRWLTYSLRSLFVLVTVMAFGLAWVAHERRQSQREAQIADELRALGATVEFARLFDVPNDAKSTDSPEEQSWWRTALGELLGPRVVSVREYRGELTDLSPLTHLKHLKVLFLERRPDGLIWLLEQVVPTRTRVRDLSPLAALKNLKWLQLNSTEVSDLSPLAGLENLQQIDLNCTPVSVLAPLSGLNKLDLLTLYSTKVSKEQVQMLQRSLPNCSIYDDVSQ